MKKEKKIAPGALVVSTSDQKSSVADSHIPTLKQKPTYPVIPEGEDKTSFDRHNRQIKTELDQTRLSYKSLFLSHMPWDALTLSHGI